MGEAGGEGSMESFLRWAAKLGITDLTRSFQSQFDEGGTCLGYSLTISHFPKEGGRGLAASRHLRKGELVLRVPKQALITRDGLLVKDNKLSFAVNGYPSLSPTHILAVCLLYEMGKGKSSFWYPYLMHLPHSYDILATFSEFEKQAFQVDDAIWATETAVAKARLEWKEASALMEELKLKPQLLTFRAWLWASATISSRTLHIPWDEAGCLCPVGDLFNYTAPGDEPDIFENIKDCMHSSSLKASSLPYGNTTGTEAADQCEKHCQRLIDAGFEEDVDAYCFYARRFYKKGEQVLLSYGTYTNLELLDHYGFLLNRNLNDKLFIPLEPEMYSSSSWLKESLYLQENGEPSFALLSALRLWATQPSQRRSVGHLAYSGSLLSIDNEIAVTKWLLKKCHTILEKLPTVIEEDHILLSVIDKVRSSPSDLKMEFSALEGEALSFLAACTLQKRPDDSGKICRSMERWVLAIQWRLGYKRILVDCISYCNERMKSL
ncbi:protein SET DOMAIN GROUP 40 [Tripterygium wilfordii]|nr:protein SET DOMAIN GROUP 40 [Tripterygium wilfordii]